jgi:hypothetical protein
VASEAETIGSQSDSFALAAGSLANGVAAYLYVVLGTQALGAVSFAPISILWTIWSFAAATLTFPIQHWVIRTVQAEGGERPIRAARTTLVMVTITATAFTLVAGVIWRDRLFGSTGFGFPLLAAAIVMSAGILGLSRGLVAARGRFKAAAMIVAGENLLRLGAGVAVVLLAGGSLAYGAALAAGIGIIVFYPSSLSPRDTGSASPASAGRMLAGIAGGTLIAQIVLTGPPVLLAALGAEGATITALFTTAAVARAPYLIALGLAIRGNARLSWLAIHEPDRLQSTTWLIAGVSVIAALIVAIAAAVIGPTIIEFVFGPSTSLPAGPTALVVGASVLALGSLAFMVVLIARGRTMRITIAWFIAGALAAASIALVDSTPLDRVTIGFMVAEGVAFVALLVATSPMTTHRPERLSGDGNS